MQITPTSLKIVRQNLQHGDIKKIAELSGYTERTVSTSLNGEAITEATKVILPYALSIIKDRKEETKKLAKQISKI
jgi:hypothetical protein